VIACLDAAYDEHASAAACVLAETWEAHAPSREITIKRGAPAAYEPGAFYKRELPLLLDVLANAAPVPHALIIDGYVWLDALNRPGLGAHFYEALGRKHAIVGVAKTSFAGSAWCAQVLRGASARPLYVTAVGMDQQDAADAVRRMHGARLPTLLKRVDALARAAL
jgi:deoxyribonuclease V